MLSQLQDGLCTLVVLIGFALLLSIKRWPQWLRRARSAHWPTVTGTVGNGEVSTRRGKGRNGGQMIERASATLAYSYQGNGTCYSGYHAETFGDEQAHGPTWGDGREPV